MHLSRNCIIRTLANSDLDKIRSNPADQTPIISTAHSVPLNNTSQSSHFKVPLSATPSVRDTMMTSTIKIKKFSDELTSKELDPSIPPITSFLNTQISLNASTLHSEDLSSLYLNDEECRESEEMLHLGSASCESLEDKNSIELEHLHSLEGHEEEEESLSSPSRKRVSFSSAHIILIPSREEYASANLSEKIWWSQAEIDSNLKNHMKKIQRVIKFYIKKYGYESKGLKTTLKGRQIFQDIKTFVKQKMISDPSFLDDIELEIKSFELLGNGTTQKPSAKIQSPLSNGLLPSFFSSSLAFAPDKFSL